MNITHANPADRVARRHQAAGHKGAVVVPTTIGIKVGTTYGIEVKLAIESSTGYLRRFRFRTAVDGTRTTIPWEGVADSGEVVSGKLVLNASVAAGEVVVWAEVVVDPSR